MTTIFADFNALTEDRSICLTTRGSQDDIRKHGIKPGDWVWLSDGELQVGAQVIKDNRYQLVAVPSWETMIDLLEGTHADYIDLTKEIQSLSIPPRLLSREEEKQVFDLWFRFERASPPRFLEIRPGFPAFRRAFALHRLGEHGLALAEMEEARPARQYLDNYDYYHMEMIRLAAPDLALDRAVELASSEDCSAAGYVAAVNIAAIWAQDSGEGSSEAIARLILEWSEKFERAPGRESVKASLLSLLHFNRGSVLLRMGRAEEGRQALLLAQAIEPLEPTLNQETRNDSFEQRAQEFASRIWTDLLLEPSAA